MTVTPTRARRIVAALATSALLLTGAAATAGPATAAKSKASSTVAIGTIKAKSVPTGKKATVRPVVKKKGKVKVRSIRITVTQGAETVVENAKAARLAAGTYDVTTAVTYRTWAMKKVTTTKKTTVPVRLVAGSATLSCTATNVDVLAAPADGLTHVADLGCVDPATRGTVAYAGLSFGLDQASGQWVGIDAQGTRLALANLTDPAAQPTVVTPVAGAKLTVTKTKAVTSTKKVWSDIITKTATQELTITTK